MSVVIEDPEVEALIERLRVRTGETVTEAVKRSVGDRLDRVQAPDVEDRRAAIRKAQERMAALPVLDTRSADEIIGYNENGLFD